MLRRIKGQYLYVMFALMVTAQLAAPAALIVAKNDILENGAEFKIKTQPIDPADPFRGRYVAIRMSLPVPEKYQQHGMFVSKAAPMLYVRLGEGVDGFSEIVEMSDKPLKGASVLKLKNVYARNSVQLPYDRYYMRESDAPKAEGAYMASRADAYATLRVLNGNGVVSGLYLDGRPIEDYMQDMDDTSGQ